jgi:hypothetical protein
MRTIIKNAVLLWIVGVAGTQAAERNPLNATAVVDMGGFFLRTFFGMWLHELGHAYVGRLFNAHVSHIELTGLGGRTCGRFARSSQKLRKSRGKKTPRVPWLRRVALTSSRIRDRKTPNRRR